MAATTEEEQATAFAREAVLLIQAGDLARAASVLRHGSAIALNNENIGAAWKALKQEEGESELVQACRRWVADQKEQDGKHALRVLATQPVAPDDAVEALKLLANVHDEATASDAITGALLSSPSAHKYLANYFSDQPTNVFEQLWVRGEESFDGLIKVLLDPTAWSTNETRLASQKDALQLCLAKLMDVGVEHPERAMKAIACLFSLDVPCLHGVVDGDGFEVIMEALDIRQPVALRSQATLATAKFFERSPNNAQRLLGNYVACKVGTNSVEGTILALSAASAIFSIVPSVAAELLLSEGFLEQLIVLVESRPQARTLQQATLELLSAACVDKTCRAAIEKHCLGWLQRIASKSSNAKNSGLASLIIVKLKDVSSEAHRKKVSDTENLEQGDLIKKFRTLILDSQGGTTQDAIEGLAYSSLRPDVKEDLASDKPFLQKLLHTVGDAVSSGPLAYGLLTIFANLTAYRPVLSEEQQRISQLKAYANANKLSKQNPLDDDSHVTVRCRAVLEAGIVPFLVVQSSKKPSHSVLSLVVQILHSLSKTPKNRGMLAQQGAVKLLLQIPISSSNGSSSHQSDDHGLHRSAAHAVARILVSVNPNHVFSNSAALPMTSAVRPLISLLSDDPTHEHRDLLPVFEALLALTNLASTVDEVRNTIIRLGWPQLENLLLTNNTLVQRATVELVCNLMASPLGVAKFADGSKQAGNRLHILLALADVDDLATRRAAGGALAMLTEWDAAADAVVARDRGVRILLGLCAEDDDEMRHRGVVCLRNLVSAPGEVGHKGKEKVELEGGVAVLKDVLKNSRDQNVLSVGVEALKCLI